MSDPYQMIGVSRDASEDDIKRAYRNLSRKYHPDANINNPNKAAAEAKFKDVQQAYQQIMKERTQGYSSQDSYGSNRQSENNNPYGDFGDFFGFGGFGGFRGNGNRQRTESGYGDSPHLKAAANYINNASFEEALNVLKDIPDRNAKWYYYSACANSGIGNNITALEHAKMAVQMEPGRPEYQELVSRFEAGSSWYQSKSSTSGGAGIDLNSCCTKLCLANIAFNLFCGNGQPCCSGGSAGL